MANPQIENGHLDLANEIVDKLCSYRISGEDWLIVWTILRKTYAWHKKEEEISITQFEKKTGLKRSNVHRAIKNLLSKRIIDVIKRDNSNINIYKFNKDFHQWQPIIKRDTPIIKKDNESIIKKDNTLKENKERTTLSKVKAIIKKDNTPNPEVKLFIDDFCTLFKSKFNISYVINGPKDGALIKNLLKSISLEELRNKADLFFSCNDDFIKKSGYTMGVFFSQINKLSTLKKSRWK